MSEITVEATDTGRDAYRVVPDPDDPIILQLDSKLCRVLDISAAGFSISLDIVEAGRRYAFSLDLPTSRLPLSGYVDVSAPRDQSTMHCHFANLPAEDVEAVHHYVLVRQKEAIRSLRQRGGISVL